MKRIQLMIWWVTLSCAMVLLSVFFQEAILDQLVAGMMKLRKTEHYVGESYALEYWNATFRYIFPSYAVLSALVVYAGYKLKNLSNEQGS